MTFLKKGEQEEMELVLSWKFYHYWLAFRILEGSMLFYEGTKVTINLTQL